MIMNMKKQIQAAVLAALAAAWIFSAPAAHGVPHWNNSDGGEFLKVDNWRDGPSGGAGSVPGATDRARFVADGAAGTYTITLNASHTIGSLWFTNGTDSTITMDLGGNTLTAADQDRPLYVISNNTTERSLALKNGTMDLAGAFSVGSVAADTNTTSTLTVQGNSTIHVRTQGGESFVVGGRGAGELRIESGGEVLVDRRESGSIAHSIAGQYSAGTNADGIVVVDGSGLLDFGGSEGSGLNYLDLATGGGNGTLEITNGGTVKNIAIIWIGRNATTGQATVKVDGSESGSGRASSLQSTTFYMSYLAETSPDRTDSLLEITNGGTVSVTSISNDAQLGSNSTLDINAGEMTVAKGINWWAGATYKLTLHGTGATPLSVGDDVTLQDDDINLVLALSGEFNGEIGDVFTVLDYTGQNVSGFFKDKAGEWRADESLSPFPRHRASASPTASRP